MPYIRPGDPLPFGRAVQLAGDAAIRLRRALDGLCIDDIPKIPQLKADVAAKLQALRLAWTPADVEVVGERVVFVQWPAFSPSDFHWPAKLVRHLVASSDPAFVATTARTRARGDGASEVTASGTIRHGLRQPELGPSPDAVPEYHCHHAHRGPIDPAIKLRRLAAKLAAAEQREGA